MSQVSKVFVDGAHSLDEVAAKASAALGRGFYVDRDQHRSEPGRPWVIIHANDLDESWNEDGYPLHTYPYVIQLEAGDDRFDVARRVFDALRADGLRVLLFDEPQGFLDQHEPDRASAAR